MQSRLRGSPFLLLPVTVPPVLRALGRGLLRWLWLQPRPGFAHFPLAASS